MQAERGVDLRLISRLGAPGGSPALIPAEAGVGAGREPGTADRGRASRAAARDPAVHRDGGRCRRAACSACGRHDAIAAGTLERPLCAGCTPPPPWANCPVCSDPDHPSPGQCCPYV